MKFCEKVRTLEEDVNLWLSLSNEGNVIVNE